MSSAYAARGMSSYAAQSSMPRIIVPPIARVIAGHYQAAALASGPSSSASASASSEGTSNAPGPSNVRIPNPFLPRRNPATGRWRPAVISLRRQADLARLPPAEMTVLPPGPKTPIRAGFSQQTTLEGSPLEDGSAPDPADALNIEWLGAPQEKVPKVGPGKHYGQRKKFKGHKFEREKVVRVADTQERLEGMDKRIEEWRKAKKDAKSSAKPSLPY